MFTPVSTYDDAVRKPRLFCGIDTETGLSDETTATPKVVCLSVAEPNADGASLFGMPEALDVFEALLEWAIDSRTTIVANHLPYDLLVIAAERPRLLPAIFRCLDAGYLECTLLREKLDDIARDQYDNDLKGRWHDLGDGRKPYSYSLENSVKIRLGRELPKPEEVRTGFLTYRKVPIDQWPHQFVKYACDDAIAHRDLADRQAVVECQDPAGDGYYVYGNAPAQTRAGFALALMRAKGIHTDPVHTERQKLKLRARMAKVQDDLLEIGFLRPGYMRPRAKTWVNPSKDTKAILARIQAVADAKGIEPKYVTRKDGSKGGLSRDSEAIELLDDPHLTKLLDYSRAEKLLAYTTILATGFRHAIHSEPNTLVANGRISWGSDSPDGAGDDARSVNLTNLPTEPGIRECYIPSSPDRVFFACDYRMLELCTVAQCCIWWLGRSRLAELLNQGLDLHSMLGSMILGIPYDEFIARKENGEALIKAVRELAKRANFGLWGGMGIDRFFSTCRDLATELAAVGIVLDRKLIEKLKKTWQRMYPESYDYFKIAKMISEGSQQLVQFISKRLRGGLGYTDAANGPFSGLAADLAKEAMYLVQRECWADPTSPLFGSWLVVFVHDELFGECLRSKATKAVKRVREIMLEVGRRYCPDLAEAFAVAMSIANRWRKGADAWFVCEVCGAGTKRETCCGAETTLVPWEESPGFAKALAKGEVEL